jgi:hypothetical protein
MSTEIIFFHISYRQDRPVGGGRGTAISKGSAKSMAGIQELQLTYRSTDSLVKGGVP